MKKGLFSKLVVIFCVAYCAFIGAWAMRILSHTGHDASKIIGVIFSLFGGELLLLCLKRIFADSDKKKKNKKDDSEVEKE